MLEGQPSFFINGGLYLLKWFINFYLDESGNTTSAFFTIAGFYNISNDHTQIQKIETKIKANILKTENSIKAYRKNNEQNLAQYILSENTKKDRELKWHTLSYDNKKFLIENIKNFNQQNISIHCNLKKWKAKNNRALNLDAIYNMMVYYLVDRTLNKSNINFNEEIAIKIFIDQRKSTPKINRKNNLESLEGYINTSLYINSKFNNVKIIVTQLDSSISPLIRYSDYYAGLTSSMCRIIIGSQKDWDKDIDMFFDTIHKKISCFCHYTIKEQCQTISKLCLKCEAINPI
ncbi:DUF3800 domain-containing protein [Spiroplasma platyhelix]|uniref:DUF3800 domain-containing protein n=1 Tax=Spiroplasma platyhelix PALS-1 TaxID=1276218 RepID=A0A846TT01_9MOLU|nr:DUF3800 domain-containing protein [Spiroplasma platyhelix]MBE4704262.1 hypothetical protein [Spiroplasma platyhelix PALS-1]NKE38635.1 DUF3800 domain-containing protein [Spiroplasma platyhelix PALS-1]UJB28846.1 hypothetical protein SPLAT_v1c00790 [Spiroplasma platyhelix PALS-1]